MASDSRPQKVTVPMPKKKDQATQQRIRKVARQEFLKKGFMAANLRKIAERAEVSLSNLYTYYPNKDALFAAVLKPQIDKIEWVMEFCRDYRPASGQPFDDFDSEMQMMEKGLDYIYKYRRPLDLLLNRAQGSKLEHYTEHLVENYQDSVNRYLDSLEQKYEVRYLHRPSPFFLHSLCHFYLKTIAEMLDHHLTRDEMHRLFKEITIYSWHGMMGLLLGDDAKEISDLMLDQARQALEKES